MFFYLWLTTYFLAGFGMSSLSNEFVVSKRYSGGEAFFLNIMVFIFWPMWCVGEFLRKLFG